MTANIRLLATASTLAVAALAATPALAEGTTAGTNITNQVTLTYKVGGIDQNSVSTSDTFKVDRKVNFVVAESGTTTTSVSPGETNAVTTFLVTNASNAALDFVLAASQQSGGTAAHGGTDNFDGTSLRIFADSNNNGSYDAGVDQAAAYLDEVPADESRRVFLLLNMPLNRATGDIAGVRLTATAAEANGAGAQGAAVTQTAGANTAEVDTVFADTDSDGNTARDGIHFDTDDYTIVAATITATKTSRVVKDPVNDTTNPKMIPGATVEYCIKVANAAGGATATGLNVTDTLPAATKFDTAFGVLVNGTVTGSTCNADGASTGSHNAGSVSALMADLAPGATRTVLFRVTIN